MNILVIDVAAEIGGALTILDSFIEEFRNDKKNKYYVVLSRPHYNNELNIKFINFTWVKKSYLHRLYFDNIYIRKLLKDINPDLILSLQNKTVKAHGIRQEVYFQNALPISEHRFSWKESHILWIYQNIIGTIIRRSLKTADKIIVQANWVKTALSEKWGIDRNKIEVKIPENDLTKIGKSIDNSRGCLSIKPELFYPANAMLYKNHQVLFQALNEIKKETGQRITLKLTADENAINKIYGNNIVNDISVRYIGYLNKNEIIDQYEHSILVFPSYIETVGLPLKEAKSVGGIILAADCEYAHETIMDYDKAYYFKPDNSSELAGLIISVFNSVFSNKY